MAASLSSFTTRRSPRLAVAGREPDRSPYRPNSPRSLMMGPAPSRGRPHRHAPERGRFVVAGFVDAGLVEACFTFGGGVAFVAGCSVTTGAAMSTVSDAG